jgi:hypothetical protein
MSLIERAPAVTAVEADDTLTKLKQGLITSLSEAISESGEKCLYPAENISLVISDPEGEPFKVERLHADESGHLTLNGFEVIDPEDQSVEGDDHAFGEEGLILLSAETLIRLVKHFVAQ